MNRNTHSSATSTRPKRPSRTSSSHGNAMRRGLLVSVLALSTMWGMAQEQSDSDLWYFQLKGPVKSIVIKGLHLIKASFDRQGRITGMTHDGNRAVVHRNSEGRIDSTTVASLRLDDHHNTKFRQRATDEHGNWIARKTQQQSPYFIGTEYCETTYYETAGE